MKTTVNFLYKSELPLTQPLRLLGCWLVCFAVSVLALTFWPAVSFEFAYLFSKIKKTHFVLEPADLKKLPSRFAYAVSESDIEILSPLDRDFGLVIPKIALNTKVFANTDLNDKESFNEVLKEGVAHAVGTSFPGQKDTIYIFGHSTDLSLDLFQANKAIFYPLNKLELDDEVDVFYNGWRYVYQVAEKKVVNPKDISFLDDSGEEKLILQTCWPPGTRFKRLVVIAKPVQHISFD